MLPRIQTVVLTNSTGNQTTATLPCGEVTIEVLTERPKGTARIQVAVDVDHKGETVVTVQEVGGTARKVVNIRNILQCPAGDMTAYEAETTIKQVSPTNQGDTVGELIPE
jgi:hypothetical protein